MIDISLAEFFRTGKFGPVEVGMSRQEVLSLLGEPDDYGCTFTPPLRDYLEAAIWLYGDIELHFSPLADSVMLIWCDQIPFPGRSSQRIVLDAWLFANDHPPAPEEMEAALRQLGIEYEYHEFESQKPERIAVFPEDAETEQFVTRSGEFRLESGVVIGIEKNETHFKDQRRQPICQEIVATISQADAQT